MDDRTEWPSEQKLRRLREAGQVPISSFACRAMGTMCFLLALWACRGKCAAMEQAFSRIASSAAPLSAAIEWGDFAWNLAAVILVPLLAGLTGSVLTGLLQTKFLFRLDLAAFRGARLSTFKLPALAECTTRPFVSLGQASVFLVVGALVLRIAWTGMSYMLNRDRIYAEAWSIGFVQLALVPLCAVLAIAALISWFVARFHFMYRHRMTRRESDSESVEMEVTL